MKTAEKLATGWLLTLGLMFLTLSGYAAIQKNTMLKRIPEGLRDYEYVNKDALYLLDSSIVNGIIFGIPTSALGVWMALGLYRQSQQQKKMISEQKTDKLQSTFYQMIQENKGQITLLGFAMHSQLPPADAKQYLDEQAKVFNANFKVSEEGGISYYFDV